ncbi:hypothetical protein [Corynebacterium diphtheriae]|uniref:hypothetical protein n=1 Tax=Corynebacterium diphtheriae TaxID=1717 RepID=UPI0008FB53F0|nr:hypothetical protein [Corynebacterium diphtheriae]OIR65824.1 hypothetical protein BHF73_10615 [Corynebacterium diphtheriae]OIR66416.1 hypothetical protein BHF76_09075 [Corynebacterium diphtheriae]OIR68030.1 hypothetical protein BHF77_05830 [Corynebacterium diphtheriae]OIR75437.1 hypothetical protein BHF78_04755 [Corynebacterium diphtheriae]OIR78928.1 hypothetical protein BHF81_01640 [Corynebacterium diphtheriae]
MTALAFILVIYFTIGAILNFAAALYEIIWGEDKTLFVLFLLAIASSSAAFAYAGAYEVMNG